MARTSENKRHSKYVIRIVCEGDKTEPLFFTDLCDQFYGDSKDFDVRTIPQPNIPVEDAEADSSRGSYKGKKRKVKSGGQKDVAEDEVITGVPPLKWVLYARKIMSEGVDESWAVYDKDEHPKHEEGMAEANKINTCVCKCVVWKNKTQLLLLLTSQGLSTRQRRVKNL